MAHHRQIVADEEIGQAQALLQAFKQVDHLRLDRDVERGNRLVADNKFWVECQGSGNADALALAA